MYWGVLVLGGMEVVVLILASTGSAAAAIGFQPIDFATPKGFDAACSRPAVTGF